jgi:hypothetical protein
VDLYEEAGPEKALEAIGRRQRLLTEEPLLFDHYKALRKLYARTKQYDKAWCACRALVFLGRADEEEQAFFDSRRRNGFEWPNSSLNEVSWSRLRHRDEDANISAVLGAVARAVSLLTATPFKKLGLRDDIPGTDNFRNLVQIVSDSLRVETPAVFVHPHVQGDVLWATASRSKKLIPVVAIGNTLYQGKDMATTVAALAKALTYSRPQYFMRMSATNSTEMEAAFLAACSLSRSDVPVAPYLMGTVKALRKVLTHALDKSELTALSNSVELFVRAGKPYDLSEWGASVDATSRRVGLLLSGDLDAAIAAAGGSLNQKEVGDLLSHSVSEGHFVLRHEIGVARDD